MLEKLKLPSLQDRRKQLRLAFFYKIDEGLVPAMPPHQFLEPERANKTIKRPIHTTTKVERLYHIKWSGKTSNFKQQTLQNHLNKD